MTEKGAEEQVLAMDRLQKFWILYQIELPFIYKSGILEAGC